MLALELAGNAQRIAEEAVALLTAPQCPSGEMTIIIDASQVGLQVHESCGHPIELDRVLGMEASFAGTSFLTLDKLGTLRYGSDVVNIDADATAPGGLGTFGFDDEGVPAQNVPIVAAGEFVGYLTSRETAPIIGRNSMGSSRAWGWNRIPIIRMTNINLRPGAAGTLEDLIADTDDGIYVETNKSWSIDDRRLNFQFGTQAGWLIKNGKRMQLVKNPTYTGITPQFWGTATRSAARRNGRCGVCRTAGRASRSRPARRARGRAGALPQRAGRCRIMVSSPHDRSGIDALLVRTLEMVDEGEPKPRTWPPTRRSRASPCRASTRTSPSMTRRSACASSTGGVPAWPIRTASTMRACASSSIGPLPFATARPPTRTRRRSPAPTGSRTAPSATSRRPRPLVPTCAPPVHSR